MVWYGVCYIKQKKIGNKTKVTANAHVFWARKCVHCKIADERKETKLFLSTTIILYGFFASSLLLCAFYTKTVPQQIVPCLLLLFIKHQLFFPSSSFSVRFFFSLYRLHFVYYYFIIFQPEVFVHCSERAVPMYQPYYTCAHGYLFVWHIIIIINLSTIITQIFRLAMKRTT